jgi:hypothetical protein
VLEVVYWVCVVVLPIGLSCPVKFVVCHRRDRDTRWAFCYSRDVGVGMLKWQTLASSVHGGVTVTPSPHAGRVGVGVMFKSPRKDTHYLYTHRRLPTPAKFRAKSPNFVWLDVRFSGRF